MSNATNAIITIFILLVFITIIIIYFKYFYKNVITTDSFSCSLDKDCNNGKCILKKCQCISGFTGDSCNVYDPQVNNSKGKCSLIPQKCDTNQDCSSCSSNIEYSCVNTSGVLNPFGVKGKYCMPVKPDKGCNIQNGGLWVWKGWQNIEGMGWDCQCQYPDAFGGPSCDDSYICLGGKFVNKDGNPYNGDCECKNIGCTKNSDCQFGPCDKGICVGQKTGIGGGFRKKCKVNIDCLYGNCNNGQCTEEPPIGNGINPQCVPDGCWSKENPKGQWIKKNNVSGYCSCEPGFYSNGYLCLHLPSPKPIIGKFRIKYKSSYVILDKSSKYNELMIGYPDYSSIFEINTSTGLFLNTGTNLYIHNGPGNSGMNLESNPTSEYYKWSIDSEGKWFMLNNEKNGYVFVQSNGLLKYGDKTGSFKFVLEPYSGN